MSSLFPRWSNTVFGLVVFLLGALTLGAMAAPMVFVRTPYATQAGNPTLQPVTFDHRHHTRDDGIDCLYCHFEAERSRYAGVPPTELCMGCHSQVWNDSPLLAPVRKSFFTKTPIRWARVHALPDFVRFDHSAHVKKGVGCVTCHGRVDLMAAVYQVAPLTMEWCLDCHRSPDENLRPLDRITDMVWQPAEPRALTGAALRRGLRAAPPTQCSTCHY